MSGHSHSIRLLLYEWCMAGGLSGGDAAIAREGRLMLETLAADAAGDRGLEVTVLCAARLTIDVPAGVRVVGVRPDADEAALVSAAQECDWAVVVAPETDGVLARRVAAVRAAAGRPLACDDRFIALAADKQATIDALAAAGVPVPAGCSLTAGASWPKSFIRPAVRKARRGVGCEGLVVVRSDDPVPPPSGVATRLEAFATGMPVGVSCICGPAGIEPLPPMRQMFHGDVPVAYDGGEPVVDATQAARARRLAGRAIAAVARGSGGEALGWVGVDLIIGRRSDGRDDRVLEVNPRLTTSFVGHARGLSTSLVRAMLEAAAGRTPKFSHAPLPFRLGADDHARLPA